MSRQELADAGNQVLATQPGAGRGRWAGLTASHIGSYERGEIRWPNDAYRAALRAVFGASDRALGFYIARTDRSVETGDAERNLDPISLRRPTSADASVDDVGHRSQLAELSPAEVEELLSYLRDQWHLLVRADNLLGPRHALNGVHTQLAILDALLRASRSNTRTRVVSLAAKYAESAAWLYEDGADMGQAQWWTSRAMEWALEADDPAMLAWVMFRRSQQSMTSANGGQVIGLAEAAGRDESILPTPMRAAIRVQLAHGHALDRNAREAGRLLDQAHEWAATDTDGDARGGHGSFCTASYIEMQRASCLTRLGQPREAAHIYERALPSIPAVYRRDRAAGLSGLAHTYAMLGEPERAATSAAEALPIAQRAGSERIVKQIRSVAHTLRRHRHMPAVAGLLLDLGGHR